MKKIFTLLTIALLSATAARAAVTVTVDGKPVADGETVTLYADDFKTAANPAPGIFFFEAKAEVNIATDAGSMKLSYSDSKPSGSKVALQFCEQGGQCLEVGTVKDLAKSNAFFDAEVAYRMVPSLPAEKGSMTVKITDGKGATFTLNVAFDTTKTGGIDAVETEVDSFSVNGKTFNYNVSAPTALSVYSIVGKQVMSTDIEGRGTIDLSDLASGIYVYRAGHSSGKFIVR